MKALNALPVLGPVCSKAHGHLAESATGAVQHFWECTGVQGGRDGACMGGPWQVGDVLGWILGTKGSGAHVCPHVCVSSLSMPSCM